MVDIVFMGHQYLMHQSEEPDGCATELLFKHNSSPAVDVLLGAILYATEFVINLKILFCMLQML